MTLSRSFIQFGVTVVIIGLSVWYLFPLLNSGDLLLAIKSVDPFPMFVICPLLILIVWVLRALRWHLCLTMICCETSLRQSYLVTGTVLGLAAITPAQSGEALKIINVPPGSQRLQATGLFAAERLFDLGVLTCIGLLGADWAVLDIDWWQVAVVSLVILVFASFGLYIIKTRTPLIAEVFVGIAAFRTKPTRLLLFALLTVTCWVGTIAMWWTALEASNVHISLMSLFLVLSLATLANITSIIPGAIGVSEASISALLILQGVDPALAITASLALRVTGLEILALGALHSRLLKRAGFRMRYREEA